jgi:hypothetical protein
MHMIWNMDTVVVVVVVVGVYLEMLPRHSATVQDLGTRPCKLKMQGLIVLAHS